VGFLLVGVELIHRSSTNDETVDTMDQSHHQQRKVAENASDHLNAVLAENTGVPM
jgi:hypothetical protein